MDRLIATGTVPFGQHDIAPIAGTPGLATDGNPAAGPIVTDWPAYAWNMISEEIRNVLIAAGMGPSSADWSQLSQAIIRLAMGVGRRVVWSANGNNAWQAPPGVFLVKSTVTAAGGSGGQCRAAAGTLTGSAFGSGGGAGGRAVGIYAVQPGQTYPGLVGRGGVSQQTGGISSFGNFLSATGGIGGQFITGSGNSPGGGGGQGVGGTIVNYGGGAGSDGQSNGAAGMVLMAGNGAPGPYGGGGRAGANGGSPGTAPGAGGGAAYSTDGSGNLYYGGAGADGEIVLEF